MIDNLLKTWWTESRYNYHEQNVTNKIIVILDRRFSSVYQIYKTYKTYNIKHVKVRYKSEQSFQTSQCSLSNHNR